MTSNKTGLTCATVKIPVSPEKKIYCGIGFELAILIHFDCLWLLKKKCLIFARNFVSHNAFNFFQKILNYLVIQLSISENVWRHLIVMRLIPWIIHEIQQKFRWRQKNKCDLPKISAMNLMFLVNNCMFVEFLVSNKLDLLKCVIGSLWCDKVAENIFFFSWKLFVFPIDLNIWNIDFFVNYFQWNRHVMGNFYHFIV